MVALHGLAILFLVAAAAHDLRDRRIDNRIVLAVAGTGMALAVHAWSMGTGGLSAVIAPVLVAVAAGLPFVGLFALGLMGGGDVKLIAATSLVAGPAQTADFLVLTCLMGGLVAGLIWVRGIALGHCVGHSGDTDCQTVPYGVAIAGAGIWTSLSAIAGALPAEIAS